MYSARQVAIGTAGAVALLAAIGAVGYSRVHHTVPDPDQRVSLASLNREPLQLPAAPASNIPSDIAQACQQDYADEGESAIHGCEDRLVREQRWKDMAARDEMAQKDVEKIRNYGSVAAADRHDAVFGDELAKCDQAVIHRGISGKAYSRCVDKAWTRANSAVGPGSSTLAPMH